MTPWWVWMLMAGVVAAPHFKVDYAKLCAAFYMVLALISAFKQS